MRSCSILNFLNERKKNTKQIKIKFRYVYSFIYDRNKTLYVFLRFFVFRWDWLVCFSFFFFVQWAQNHLGNAFRKIYRRRCASLHRYMCTGPVRLTLYASIIFIPAPALALAYSVIERGPLQPMYACVYMCFRYWWEKIHSNFVCDFSLNNFIFIRLHIQRCHIVSLPNGL